MMPSRRFIRFAWGTLLYTLFVIIWGGFVRATGSGAGCGDNWPLCNGEVIPRSAQLETMIEFTHRLTSGLALLLVVGLVIWAFRVYGKGHLVRRGAVWSLVFMVLEALIGAGLVLLELVAYNVSVARGYWMVAHLVNTFLLLAALALTAWWASGGGPVHLWDRGTMGWMIGGALVGTLIVGASGAVAALGDTLTLGGGLSPDDDPVVAALVGLRIYHPLLACLVSLFVISAVSLTWQAGPDPTTRRLAMVVLGVYGLQLVLGLVNVWLQAPVWMQMVHLLTADVLWIALVLFATSPSPKEIPLLAEEGPGEVVSDLSHG